jgi:hypothetical protein
MYIQRERESKSTKFSMVVLVGQSERTMGRQEREREG